MKGHPYPFHQEQPKRAYRISWRDVISERDAKRNARRLDRAKAQLGKVHTDWFDWALIAAGFIIGMLIR